MSDADQVAKALNAARKFKYERDGYKYAWRDLCAAIEADPQKAQLIELIRRRYDLP